MVLVVASVCVLEACGSNAEPAPRATTTTTAAAADSAPAPPATMDLETPITPCAEGTAPAILGTARFERGGDAGSGFTLVIDLQPVAGVAYDVALAPRSFGSIEAPTLTLERGNAVIRSAVKFTADAYATVIVGVKCGQETGLVSAGVRWKDTDIEPGKTAEVVVSPYGKDGY